MNETTFLVITSIAKPDNKVLQLFAQESKLKKFDFIVIGDKPSPADFHIEGCQFYGLETQKKLDFAFAKKVPERHYSRKNIGYLQAIKSGAKIIVETDDDNFPKLEFWNEREAQQQIPVLENQEWVNIYNYFTKNTIWPRGYPLEEIQKSVPELNDFPTVTAFCPIQQGLADENPDVDAVFRLTNSQATYFDKNIKVGLGKKSWCPFNSQNTSFFPPAFPLMYLPSYCSFRMTDIWRSFVAQRICWENQWTILFDEASVWQERNSHNLLRDFEDELPGYLNNHKICKTLEALELKKGEEHLFENLKSCYQSLVNLGVVGEEELPLLDCWIADLKQLGY